MTHVRRLLSIIAALALSPAIAAAAPLVAIQEGASSSP